MDSQQHKETGLSRRGFLSAGAMPVAAFGSLALPGCSGAGAGLDKYGGWTELHRSARYSGRNLSR